MRNREESSFEVDRDLDRKKIRGEIIILESKLGDFCMAALTPGQTCNLPWNTVTSSHLAIVGKLKNSAFGKDILN